MITGSNFDEERARLAARIRQLRKERGVTGVQLATDSGMSQSKISKIETAVVTPTRDDIDRLTKALKLPKSVTKELTEHVATLETEFNSWRMLFRNGAKREQERHNQLEAEAKAIRLFQPVVVPGLLQTAAYAREVIASVVGDDEEQINEALATRMERQAILYDTSKTFSFVITESALKWVWKSSSLMRAQYDRLLNVATLDHVSIAIIPEGARLPAAPWNMFCIYDDELVTVDTFTAEVFVRDKRDVYRYGELFDAFRSGASHGDDALALIQAFTTPRSNK